MTYFVEFEFKSHYGYTYWFPLYITASKSEVAEDHAKRIETGIKQYYDLRCRSRVVPVLTGINSERIAEYRKTRAVGKPVWLNVTRWTMKSVEGVADIPFERQSDDEALKAFDGFRDGADFTANLATGHETKFPVHVTLTEKPLREDFLAINVVMPSH